MGRGMGEVLVGAGGWGYFRGSLDAYARGFRFVEVNASFYRPVPELYARRWRSGVPPDFVFAVKANRVVTHSDGLLATARGRSAFAHDLRIARILRAPFVILETPPGLALGPKEFDGLSELASMTPSEVRIGLEARAYRRGDLPAGLRQTMEATRTIDVVDLSQTAPRVEDEVVYSRLFGPGPHNVYQFDDAELREIDRAGGDAVRTAFTFHGVRMYQDAARFLTFKRTGSFPPTGSARGLSSLEEALRPDAQFPASKEDLVQGQGWKVFDVDDRTRAHAATVLERLPDRVYADLGEVISELRTVSVGLSE
jgi:uncharacterized protein YecE (DUF72 family)